MRLTLLPLGSEVEREVNKVVDDAARYGDLRGPGQDQPSLAATIAAAEALLRLHRPVRRRLDELMERTPAGTRPQPEAAH